MKQLKTIENNCKIRLENFIKLNEFLSLYCQFTEKSAFIEVFCYDRNKYYFLIKYKP